jgi:hypothetical protein
MKQFQEENLKRTIGALIIVETLPSAIGPDNATLHNYSPA